MQSQSTSRITKVLLLSVISVVMLAPITTSAEKPTKELRCTPSLVKAQTSNLFSPKLEFYKWEINVIAFHEETRQAYLIMSPDSGGVIAARATVDKSCKVMKSGITKNYAREGVGVMLEEIVSRGAEISDFQLQMAAWTIEGQIKKDSERLLP